MVSEVRGRLWPDSRAVIVMPDERWCESEAWGWSLVVELEFLGRARQLRRMESSRVWRARAVTAGKLSEHAHVSA